jgi:hypothetical protein
MLDDNGSLSTTTRGVLAVIGGVMWLFQLGSLFMIGSLEPYILSYYEDATEGQVQTIMPIVIAT